MKKIIPIFCWLLITVHYTKAQTPYDTTNLNGIWLYNSSNTTNETLTKVAQLPFKVSGSGIYLKWSALEPADNAFNWLLLDTLLMRLQSFNLKANLMIWAGPSSPEWIYQPPYNIDSVKTLDPKNTFAKYPYYFHPAYKLLWYRMLDSVFIHLQALPDNIRNNIKIFQSAQGTTGDLDWYKGSVTNTPPPFSSCNCNSYNIADKEWVSFIKDEWKRTDSLLKLKLPATNHLINAGTDKIVNSPLYKDAFLWTRINIPSVLYKANNMAHWYQLNTEASSRIVYDSILNKTQNCVPLSRARDEYDLAQNNAELKRPAWHKYFTAINALYFGVDMWNIFTQDLIDSSNADIFRFFIKYAGAKDAACSPGAFSVLHDGLDAGDTIRFPVKIFGNGTMDDADSSGRRRSARIARFYASKGATQYDGENGQGGSYNQATAQDLNDVGWNIFTGNYERYLYQKDANTTSTGYWQQGDTTQVYGRFARGFEHAALKDTMFFDMDDVFAAQIINNSCSIKIIYLDRGGSFKLMYDAADGTIKTAKEYNTANTNRWIVDTVNINDAAFLNRCSHSADIMLVNTDDTDELFHLVEVMKAE